MTTEHDFHAACRVIARNPQAVVSRLNSTQIQNLAQAEQEYHHARSEFERAKSQLRHAADHALNEGKI